MIQVVILFFVLMAFSLMGILGYHLHMDEKINALVNLARFKDTVVLLRQTEASCFRNLNQQDYEENRKSFDSVIRKLAASKKYLHGSEYGYEEIEKLIANYQKETDRLFSLDKQEEVFPEKKRLQTSIRRISAQLQDVSKLVFKNAEQSVRNYLSKFRLVVVLVFFVILFLTLYSGCGLSKQFVNPLKVIEQSVQRIGKGDFAGINMDTRSHIREIQVLMDSINKMSHELTYRQDQIIYTKKLAFMSTIISGIVHALNTPLLNVSTAAKKLFQEMELTDMVSKKELTEQILTQNEKATDMINSLRQFAQSGVFEMKLMNLKKFFAETVSIIKNRIPSNIDLIVNIPDGVLIRADKQSFQQVVMNLVDNAVSAVPDKKKGEIIISARKSSSKECIEIVFKDTGEGIEPDVLPHIFEPFFSKKVAGHSLGLGLYIVNDIVEFHRGKIKVKSKPDEGTTFIIYLPLGAAGYWI
ncbi:MAG TPA: HAMP domain-containing sensor histidine kinase [Thermodesulfovibrionia bacterium]|nr:HAMP domain-containing sensor histidine kinase [Thermodesulfovibrionia bacterium]